MALVDDLWKGSRHQMGGRVSREACGTSQTCRIHLIDGKVAVVVEVRSLKHEIETGKRDLEFLRLVKA